MLNKVLFSLFICFALLLGYWIFFGLGKDYQNIDVNLDMPAFTPATPKPLATVEAYDDTDHAITEKESMDSSPSEPIDTAPIKTRLNEQQPKAPDADNWPEGIPRPGDKGTLMSPSLRELGDEWVRNPNARTNFTMPIANGQEVEIEVKEFAAIGDDGGEFIGTIKGYPDSKVSLSYRGSAEAGLINLPSQGRSIHMLPGANGQFFFHESAYSPQENQQPPIFDQPLPPPPNFIPPPPPEDFVFPDLPDSEEPASPTN
jgi:hypothetical protein